MLTDRERDILRGDADVSANYRSTVAAKVKKRLERIEEDIDVIREHHSLKYELPERLKPK